MSKGKQNSMDKILNDIDTDELGETMMDKAESLQMEFGDNIVIFDIALEELQKGNLAWIYFSISTIG